MWRVPVEEHFALLAAAGFTGEVHVGLVGDGYNRGVFRAELAAVCPSATICAEYEYGHEQVTLACVRQYATDHPDALIYYAHPKGAFHPADWQHAWRRAMEVACTTEWRNRIEDLRDHDAVGLHWLAERKIFGGNFWWATARYLNTLPPVGGIEPEQDRYSAEGWIGLADPHVRALSTDQPEYPTSERDDPLPETAAPEALLFGTRLGVAEGAIRQLGNGNGGSIGPMV